MCSGLQQAPGLYTSHTRQSLCQHLPPHRLSSCPGGQGPICALKVQPQAGPQGYRGRSQRLGFTEKNTKNFVEVSLFFKVTFRPNVGLEFTTTEIDSRTLQPLSQPGRPTPKIILEARSSVSLYLNPPSPSRIRSPSLHFFLLNKELRRENMA